MSYYLLKKSRGAPPPPPPTPPSVQVGVPDSDLVTSEGFRGHIDFLVSQASAELDLQAQIREMARKRPELERALRRDLRQLSKNKAAGALNLRKEVDRLKSSSRLANLTRGRDQISALLEDSGNLGFRDLREAIEMLTGEGFSWMVLRQTDRSQKCACTNDMSYAGKCRRCLGTGFPFTDMLVKGFLWARTPGVEFYTVAGKISTNLRNLVVEYNRPVKKFDQVLEISLDPDTGDPIQPYQIVRSYVLADVMPMRGKGGRVEFWKAIGEERTITDDRRGEGGTGYQHKSNR